MVVTAVRVQIRRPHSIHPNKYLALSISYTNIHRGCCQHKLSSRILAAPPLCPCARFHLIYSSHLGSVLPEPLQPSRPSLNAPPHQWQTLHSPLQKAFSSQRFRFHSQRRCTAHYPLNVISSKSVQSLPPAKRNQIEP